MKVLTGVDAGFACVLVNHYLAHYDAGFMFVVPEDIRDELLHLSEDYYAGEVSLQDISFYLAESYFADNAKADALIDAAAAAS